MKIRRTRLQELPAVMAIYDHARAFMAENGNPRQWGTAWPPEDLIRRDIEAGKSYVCVQDGPAADGAAASTASDGAAGLPDDIAAGCGERRKAVRCEEKTAPDDQILAVFYYDFGSHVEPGYDHLETAEGGSGTWSGNEEYGVVHRIATSGNGRGVGSFCIRWAFDQCHNLRMDTHPDNKVMQHTLLKNGFQYRGIIHVTQDNDPRFAYEKVL